MASSYVEFEPRPELRPWVRRVWSYADSSPSHVVQRIAPDGCAELVVHLGEPYEEARRNGRFARQPAVLFAGQLTQPLGLRATGPLSCVAVRFEPDGAAPWFGRPMHEATNLRISVAQRFRGVDLRALPPDECLARLQAELVAAMGRDGWEVDPGIRSDVARIEKDGAIPDLAAAERRRKQRRFLRCVGVPAQTLQSIFRFRKVFDRAAGQDGGSWLSAALEAGYFDQPQMARDFRRFLGCTATEWAREQVELARSITMPLASTGGASQSYKRAGGEGR